jgi:hypothetical protein
MSRPLVKKIALMASHDWTLRAAMAEFFHFVDPVFHWKGKDYRIELTRVIAAPVVAGEDLSRTADLIVDRTTHWNPYYRSWGHQATNSLARMVNHSYTFAVYDKHSTYDLMARAMHPRDRFPRTVLLPLFQPWTEDQLRQWWWKTEQTLIIEHTEYGFDPARRRVDMDKVREKLATAKRFYERSRIVRTHFGQPGDYLRETVEKVFENRFPIYLKKAYGGGGSKVFKVHSLEELYERYDQTGEEAFHLQEAIEPYDVFYRAMGIGPIIFPMIFQPDLPLHEHYSPEKPVLDPEVYHRLESYVMFINAYHRWTYNSFECLLRDGALHPIDFANACPDSHLSSLHVHFPLLVIALFKWLSFCAVTEKDMRIDLEMTRYLRVLNDPDVDPLAKFQFCRRLSEEYFEIERFQEFCEQNCQGLEEQMIEFYDRKFDEIIRFAIEFSDFPPEEHEHFYHHYKHLMDDIWRPNARLYLNPAVLAGNES